MKELKRSKKDRSFDKETSDKLSKQSRNVSRLQEKQTKRGRFTKFS